MSAAKNDGGFAFPTDEHPSVKINGGMSLRDWFAGQALPAVIAATSAGQHIPSIKDSDTHISFAIARDAYFMADAMLRARSESLPPLRTGGRQ